MDLQTKYREEKEGIKIRENEELFYSYQIIENEFHVLEVFIREDLRGNSKIYYDSIVEFILTFPEIKFVVGYIHIGVVDSERSLASMLKFGFKLCKVQGDRKIILLKELR